MERDEGSLRCCGKFRVSRRMLRIYAAAFAIMVTISLRKTAVMSECAVSCCPSLSSPRPTPSLSSSPSSRSWSSSSSLRSRTLIQVWYYRMNISEYYCSTISMIMCLSLYYCTVLQVNMLELWLHLCSLVASCQSESCSFTHRSICSPSAIFGAPLLTPRDANLL